jgi:ABC-type transport system involved in cytochrome c biogenesis permease component
MTVLPVVERELRVAARRRGTYWSRFTAGTIGAGLAAFTLLSVTGSNEDIGGDLFAVVGTVVFLYAAFAGTLATCDCLSEEKREGTLGLLFLTDLKGRDVVLGKLAATSLNVFYGMLAVLPMLAIPFVLGGVTHAEMLRVVLVSINLLFFFLSIGLFVSSLCRQDNWALGLSSLIALALVVGGPMASQIPRFPFPDAALFSSPACACFLAFDPLYSAKVGNPHAAFWGNVALTQLYAWVFFWLACWIVPRSWQDAVVGKRARWREGTRSSRNARRRAELLEINPFLWRVARSGRKRLMVWLALVVSALLFILCFHWFSGDLWDPGADFFLLLPLGLLLKVWLAAEAGRTFSEDRRGGGLELLLSTPLAERQIVRGQLLALWRQFALPAGVVLLANLVFVLVEMRKWGNTGDRSVLLVMHLILGGFLVADLIALSWVGMWQGLICRKPNRAALLSLTRILVLPPLLFVLGFWFWAISHEPGSGQHDTACAFTFWILLGLGADLYFALAARRKLSGQFRAIAAEGIPPKRPAEPAPRSAPAVAVAP